MKMVYEVKEYKIEIDNNVYDRLIEYCNENDISINSFIELNLENVGA